MRKRGNNWRRWVGKETLAWYANAKRGMEWEHDQTRMTDLLADLMHFAAATKGDAKVDFERALASAQAHFKAEYREVKK